MSPTAASAQRRDVAREIVVDERPLAQPRVAKPRIAPRTAKVLAEQALAMETLGDKHRARLLWMEVARRGESKLIVQHRVLRRLGRHALARRDHETAVALLERHLALLPNDAAASEQLLEARLSLAGVTERSAIYDEHVARFRETAATLCLRATMIDRTVSPSCALATLLKAEALSTDKELVRLARAYETIGDLGRALAVLDRLTAQGARSHDAMRAKLRLLQAMDGSKNASVELARGLVAAQPDEPSYHGLLGRTFKQYGDWAAAAAAFEKALSLDRFDVAYWEGALACYAALERDERIDELLAEARRQFAGDGPEGKVSFARIALAGGSPQEAIEAARSALGSPVAKTSARLVLADGLMETGAYHKAWTHIEALLQGHSADLDLRRASVRCASALTALPSPGGVLPTFPDALFIQALTNPPERPLLPPTDTVMLVTSSLGAGGAERQVALTAAGVSRARAGQGSTVLVGLDLTPARGRSIMRPVAETEHLLIEDLAGFAEGQIFRTLTAEDPRLRPVLRLIGSFPKGLARDILKLYDCFRRHRPSVVHLWQDGVISTGSVAAVLAGVPTIVCSMRNVVAGEGDRRRYRSYLATMYRALATRPEVRFTANSAAGARDYETWLGMEPGRIRVLRNGVDVASIRARTSTEKRQAVRERLGLSETDLLIGGVFRLAPAKRPQLWLDVVARVAAGNPRVRGVIVGDGAMRAELEESIARRGLTDRIILAGRQSPVEPWMSAMDALLLASEVEGLPNVLLEAEALGVPVVTTEAGGSGEALLEGVTGLLVKDDTPQMLADALTRVMRSAGLRHRARVGAPVFIEQRFGIERMIRETLAAFGSTRPATMERTQ